MLGRKVKRSNWKSIGLDPRVVTKGGMDVRFASTPCVAECCAHVGGSSTGKARGETHTPNDSAQSKALPPGFQYFASHRTSRRIDRNLMLGGRVDARNDQTRSKTSRLQRRLATDRATNSALAAVTSPTPSTRVRKQTVFLWRARCNLSEASAINLR